MRRALIVIPAKAGTQSNAASWRVRGALVSRMTCRGDDAGAGEHVMEPAHGGSSIDKGSTARLRVHPRRIGTPRPRHARSLDAGRSPGSRVVRLVPPSRLATMARGTRLAAHSCGGSSLALGL